MNLSSILDTAIGLVFVYFLLSLIASGIQEVVAGIFAWRGTYLARGIDVILDNNSAAAFGWAGVCEWLLAHFSNKSLPTAAGRLAKTIADQNGPATPAQQTLQRVLSVHAHPLMKGTPSAVPSYIPARNFSLALLQTLRDGSKAPLFSQAERTIDALPDGDLKSTLSAFLESAGGDLDTFRSQLEQWFDDAMDRLAGVYKRNSQYILIVLGVLIAVLTNVDSIRVARTLWETPALRAALVDNAQQVAASQMPTPCPKVPASSTPQNSQTPPGANKPAGTDTQPGCDETPDAILKSVMGPYQSLEDTHIPFGWSEGHTLKDVSWATIGGWAVTAAAIGLGAPFWFGLLQTLVNIRSSGSKPKPADNGDGDGAN